MIDRLEIVIRLIRDLGFPIAVAAFLLWQVPQLRDAIVFNATATEKLRMVLDQVSTSLHDEASELREHRRQSERALGLPGPGN